MTETLLIHYQPQSQQAHWALINERGRCISKPSQGSLADISNMAKGRRATVLLDSAWLNIESVNIPSQNRQRQLQAVPFALEEQLATDIEDMHFALGKKSSDHQLPVITISKSFLIQLLQQFSDAGITVEVLGADVLALPYAENTWSVLLDEHGALIKTGHSDGYYCDRDNLPVILSSLLGKEHAAQSIRCYHRVDDEHGAELVSKVAANVSIKTYTRHALEIFAQHLQDAKQINILQGKFAARRKSNLALRPWKSVAALFVIWMLVELVAAALESQQLEQKNQALRSQIEKEFKRANPAATKYNNMRKRIERQLKQLQTGGSGDAPLFLDILSSAAPAFAQHKNISIEGIVYRNQYVDMDLQADSLQSLEQLKTLLTANRKLKVVLSTTVEKNKTRGRLRLETQG